MSHCTERYRSEKISPCKPLKHQKWSERSTTTRSTCASKRTVIHTFNLIYSENFIFSIIFLFIVIFTKFWFSGDQFQFSSQPIKLIRCAQLLLLRRQTRPVENPLFSSLVASARLYLAQQAKL